MGITTHNSKKNQLAINGGKPIREIPIYYGKQHIDKDDIKAVVDVLNSPLITCGPKVSELEEKLCDITKGKYSIAIANGTAALHAACYAAGISHGDEVITTPLTFAATANSIIYMGGRPVFADIDEKTFNINPTDIEKKITSKTKAVIAVDYAGQATELDSIKDLCEKNNLVLIEDGAHSIGTKYKGNPVGSIADLTTFSFHPVKTVTCGEGGAVITNRDDFYQKLLLFRTHGITREEGFLEYDSHGPWYYEQLELGYNYRLTDIQAALLISQLNKLELFKKRRNEIVQMYDHAFSEMEELSTQIQMPVSETTRHLYVLSLNLEKLSTDRRGIFEALWAENICCNVHYIPVYYFPYYQSLGYKKGLCPIAENVYDRILSLPIYFDMSDRDVKDVINGVRKVINYYKV